METNGYQHGYQSDMMPDSATDSHNGMKPRRGRRHFTLLIAFATMCIAIVSGYLAGQQVAIQSLDAAASHRLDVFRASFFTPVERFEYLPDLLAAHPVIIDTLERQGDAKSQAALNTFLQNANDKAASAAVYVMNRDGLTVASSNWTSEHSFVGKNFSYRPYFQEALQGKVGRFYGVGSVTGVPGFFLAYAVRNRNAIIGVVSVKIDLDNLDQRWEAGSDQINVTDNSGIIFLSSSKEWKYRTTKSLSPEIMHRLRETRQYATMLKTPLTFRDDSVWLDKRVVRIKDSENGITRRYFTLSRPLPQAGWTITTYSSMKQAEGTAATYAFMAAGGTAFLMLLAMYMQLLKRRSAEKEEARKAADIAHEQLEAKHNELEILSQHLKAMATSDPLTGCHNRHYFTEIAGKMVSAAYRHNRQISVLMLDIDFFKKINDTWGHPAGDEVLKAVAAACQSVLRQPDFLVRFGGEEFVAILPDTNMDEAIVAAERLRNAVQSLTVPAEETELNVTLSIGISEFANGEASLDKALARADIALYHAKHGGRNCCVAYRPEMETVNVPLSSTAH